MKLQVGGLAPGRVRLGVRGARRGVLGHLGIYEGFPAGEGGGGICFLGTKCGEELLGASEECLGIQGSPG